MTEARRFSRKDLWMLIVPLVIEQALAYSVGMIDTVMVANVGEAAVSGVSLVETVNILLINLFAALGTGGAIVVAQYLGMQDTRNGNDAAKQLIIAVLFISLLIAALCLLANRPLLSLLFGQIEPEVMRSARTYFYITALSYPFIAVFSAAAALFRGMGNTRTAMLNALVMNVLNLIGNAVLMFVFGLGVLGAAISTLVSRVVAATIMLAMLRNPKLAVHVRGYSLRDVSYPMIRRILRIGIPNGLENSVFQLGRIIITGLVTLHGTTAIAAHAVANSLTGIEVIPGQAIGLALLTITAQCVGAKEYDQAKRYTKLLTGLAYASMIGFNAIMLVLIRPIIGLYHLSGGASVLAVQIMVVHGVGAMLVWPLSFTLPNALRAAGDVRYPMAVSILSMLVFRIGVSCLLVYGFHLGAISVWLAMVVDWIARSILFVHRFRGGRWKRMTVV